MKYLLVLLFTLPLIATAEIYKWTDDSGRVHFGDSPSKKDNAEKVTVEINSYEHVSYENIEFYSGLDAERVTMFSTSWCGYCKKARHYFQSNGINYIEYDIEKSKQAKRMYDSIGGKGVPVILHGKKRMNGFSAAGFERIFGK